MKENPNAETAKEQALMNAINEKKKSDLLMGIRIGSKEVVQRLVEGLKDESGVHIESLLAIIGSLAGYSCHMACRKEYIDSGKYQENEVFTVIKSADGRRYYYGELPNKSLVEGQLSVWGLGAGITQWVVVILVYRVFLSNIRQGTYQLIM